MLRKFLALHRHSDWRARVRRGKVVMRRYDNGWHEREATKEEIDEYMSREGW